MTLSFRARVVVNAEEKTKAIFDSLNTDNEYYPENPTETKIFYDESIFINIVSDQIPHLRANLNSTLRLVQASFESIESVKK